LRSPMYQFKKSSFHTRNSISTSNVDVNRIPLPPGGEGSGEGGISNKSGQWQFHPPPTPPIKGGELSLRYGTLDEEFE